MSNESSANKQISQYPPMSMGLNQFRHQVQNIQTLPLYSGVPAMATQNVQQSHIAGHSNYTYFDTVKPSSYSSHDAIQQLGPHRTLVFIPASQPETKQPQQNLPNDRLATNHNQEKD